MSNVGKAWSEGMRQGLLAGDPAKRIHYLRLTLDGRLVAMAIQRQKAAAAARHADWFCALPIWERLIWLAWRGSLRRRQWWELRA
jgi:hypothetical protein